MLFAALMPPQFAAGQQPSSPSSPPAGGEAIIGRWNLRHLGRRDVSSSWLEVERSGFTALVGRYVGLIGGARPIGKVEWSDGVARFTIPSEWEPSGDLRFEVRPTGDSLSGTMVWPNGIATAFVGRRAPILRRAMPTAWSAPVALFNGRDFTGWTPAPTARSLPNYWIVRDGALVNTAAEGTNLMTVRKFQDFKLHAEFRLPTRRTSGIFPRGRYWVILANRADSVPFKGTMGAVHRFLVPNENAALGPDRWQAIDITLVGRRITIVVNGKTVIADQIIPGITGSAIDSDEEAPGPIMLQGEEQQVEFREITISEPLERSSQSTGASCGTADSADAAAAVRTRLAEWVRQANADDSEGMREVWAPGLVGWFPRAQLFSDSAAYAIAGLSPSAAKAEQPRTRFQVAIADLVASGTAVVVHDVWTETRTFPQMQKSVSRAIRGSELWLCQPDGRWRIARYVSAPEPWTLAK